MIVMSVFQYMFIGDSDEISENLRYITDATAFPLTPEHAFPRYPEKRRAWELFLPF